MAEISNYKVAASPHELDNSNTRRIMLDVLIALLPCVVCGTLFYGLYSLLLVVICTATCFLSEQIFNLARRKPFTLDLSALVTGVILGLNLPPRAPWYIPVIGGVFAIVIVKMLFGGIGKNFANPAATARVFLLLAYSSVMAQYIGADISGNLLGLPTDIVTAPTYLSGGTAALADSFWGVSGYAGYILQLLFGYTGGSIGETCAVAILAGGVYLTVRRVIDWRIPAVYILTAAVMVLACYQSAAEIPLQLLSGGLLFGAVFMATDYATSPKWRYNRIFYAIGLGVITVIIRRFGAYPEGTSLAILIMNLLVPVMDRMTLPVRFGQRTKSGKPMPRIAQWTALGLCGAMALALLAGVPAVAYTEVSLTGGTYSSIRDVSRNFRGEYVFTVRGSAYLADYDYTQPLEYVVTLDGAGERVTDIEPVEQSTMGYTAELSLFEGKAYRDILALTELGTDAELSATHTNESLRAMILECFAAYDYNLADYEAVAYTGGNANIVRAERRGDLYRFTIDGVADLVEYNYRQPLCYAVTLDASSGTVYAITTVTESTMGYTLDKPLFLGKTEAELSAMTEEDIQTDITTGATVTNVAARDLLVQCFAALEEVSNG